MKKMLAFAWIFNLLFGQWFFFRLVVVITPRDRFGVYYPRCGILFPIVPFTGLGLNPPIELQYHFSRRVYTGRAMFAVSLSVMATYLVAAWFAVSHIQEARERAAMPRMTMNPLVFEIDTQALEIVNIEQR